MKMQRTIVIRRDYLHYIRKYNRFEKRHKNMSVHLSPCFRCMRVTVVVGGVWGGAGCAPNAAPASLRVPLVMLSTASLWKPRWACASP